MKVQTDFQVKHFIAYTKLKGGELRIFDTDFDSYMVRYNEDNYNISHEAMEKIMLMNQELMVSNRILQ